MVRTAFWMDPIVSEELSPEDRYFYLYLLTNPQTTQTGIYKITKKQMAFDLGYSIESVHTLMERFTLHHKLIRYNPETREIAIKNWAKDNLQKVGKPVIDCIYTELKEVEDLSLISYVSASLTNQSFCQEDEWMIGKEGSRENDSSIPPCEELDDTFTTRYTISGQKEKENKKEKQQQKQQKAFPTNRENPLQSKDVKAIVEFWDSNGFDFTNRNAKDQLLLWLNDSRFLQPKEIVLMAMKIACANNKRKLNYIVGILKNWENESLLTVEEIDPYLEKQNGYKRDDVTVSRGFKQTFEWKAKVRKLHIAVKITGKYRGI